MQEQVRQRNNAITRSIHLGLVLSFIVTLAAFALNHALLFKVGFGILCITPIFRLVPVLKHSQDKKIHTMISVIIFTIVTLVILRTQF